MLAGTSVFELTLLLYPKALTDAQALTGTLSRIICGTGIKINQNYAPGSPVPIYRDARRASKILWINEDFFVVGIPIIN